MKARRLLHVSLTTRDLNRSVLFYTRALGFAAEHERRLEGEAFARIVGVRNAEARAVTLRLGADSVELVEFAQKGRAYPIGSTSTDLWFQHFAIIVTDIDAAHARLARETGWTAISSDGPQLLPASSGGATAFKFRDPDGHPLELLSFPPDAVPARWRDAAPGAVCLGVDHTAIAVADTARAEAFYVGMLGLSVGGRSVNRGVAQEQLDGTFNALVEVTALLTPDEASPHLELLCNRVPATGRPIAIDTRPNDVAATRLVIETDDLAGFVNEAIEKRLRFVSAGIVTDAEGRESAMLHDIDGHLLLLQG